MHIDKGQFSKNERQKYKNYHISITECISIDPLHMYIEKIDMNKCYATWI